MVMTAQEIRRQYFEFMVDKGHQKIPRANLIPQNDPTTLFTGSGMQPLIPYLLGEEHPAGKRLVDSQTCFRAEDMDEVGDNRHTTFFEMLGNWSLGDYYKKEQLTWFWQFLTEEIKLPKDKLWVSCFEGDEKLNLPRDEEAQKIWLELGVPKDKIRFYGSNKNWWSRSGVPENMPDGEPGGPDSEVFYEFTEFAHNPAFGKECHPNCDCGRFLEIGNSVFMEYKKTATGFEKLAKPNVDFGGGLERISAAKNNDPDVFKISLLWPIIEGLQNISGKKYDEHQESMRVIADHLRAAMFLIVDGATPSNKEQGYVVRRLLRRAVRFAFDLGIEQDLSQRVAPIIADLYKQDFPELLKNEQSVIECMVREEKTFHQTLRYGQKELEKMLRESNDSDEKGRKLLSGGNVFKLYDTFGYPKELTAEVVNSRDDAFLSDNWNDEFANAMKEQVDMSRTASQGMFKGGLADHSEQVVKYHTATHLMYQALKQVLGEHVVQKGSNITAERLRFDFSHPEKVTREQLDKVEKIVNEKIAEDLPVSWAEEPTNEALKTASGAFGDKYGDKVKVYTIGNPSQPFSREICGGPHVEYTGQIGEGGKTFKIIKEEASSAGVRRIKAILQ